MLEHVSKVFGQRLKVCLLHEEIPATLRNIYGIEGTPTYLIVDKNKVVDQLLGQVDLETLTRFIERTLLRSY
jgi:thioredoxin-related protein